MRSRAFCCSVCFLRHCLADGRLPGRKRICPECGGTDSLNVPARSLRKKMKSERA